MQTYAPRDPLAEFLRGDITLRKLRIMVEGIPTDTPTTPIGRAINGPWGDIHRLLHVTGEALIQLNANYYNANRGKDSPAIEAEKLWKPELTPYQQEAENGQKADDLTPEERQEIENDLLSL